jgi:DNA-binding NtrC family response regulator
MMNQIQWQGNVRALSNVLDLALSTISGNVIHASDLPFETRETPDHCGVANVAIAAPLREVVANAEKAAIVNALKAAGNNKARSADLLGIHRTLLYKKMNKYRITL